MKKALTLIWSVIVALCLCLTAYGDNNNSTSNESSASAESPSDELRNKPQSELEVYLYNYWRNDIPEGSEKELPKNYRTCTSKFHDYDEFGEEEGLEKDYQPDLTGLDTLNASGSGYFNEAQFAKMVETLRSEYDGTIYDVDLRREPHGQFNDTSVTWYSKFNLYMVELSDAEADVRAGEFMQAAEGTSQVLYDSDDYPDPSKTIPIEVTDVTTEDELCAKYDVNYVHIPCTDHICPSDAEFDMFIRMVRDLPENAWLHIHCSGGKGRATTFLVLYDMMRNPGVSLKDIAYRQAYLGKKNVLNPGKDGSWKEPYITERAEIMPKLYDYVQANYENGFTQLWSEYRQAKGF